MATNQSNTVLDQASKWAISRHQSVPELCQEILDSYYRNGPEADTIAVERIKAEGHYFLVCYLPQINETHLNPNMWRELLDLIKTDLFQTAYFGTQPVWQEPNQVWCPATDDSYWDVARPNWDVDHIKGIVRLHTLGIKVRRLSGQTPTLF